MVRNLVVILFVLLIGGCDQKKHQDATSRVVLVEGTVFALLPDSVFRSLVEPQYTSQNQQDGIEYATVDSLNIINMKFSSKDSTCDVRYCVKCSYSSAVRSPGYETSAPPPLIEEKNVKLAYKRGKWFLLEN